LALQRAPAQAAAHEQRCYQQRGGRAASPGQPRPPHPDRRRSVLVAVVYLRQVCSQQVLADLLRMTPSW
jgi:hypothetical protein